MAKSKKPTKKPSPKKAEPRTVKVEVVEDSDTSPVVDRLEAEKAYTLPRETQEPEGLGPSADSKALSVPGEAGPLTTKDPLTLYLNEIRQYRLLTREEEQELAKKYFETKDPGAAEALVKANLRFVVKIAAEYSKFSSRMIDLIQEGNVGLMHAVREFNPYKGTRLITYAVWWIRGYIQEYLMKQYSMVRIGTTQNQRKLFYQLQKQKQALDQMGDSEQLKLVSSRLGIPAEEVAEMAQRLSGRDVSLDRPLDDQSSTRLSEMQTDQNSEALDDTLARNEQITLLKEKLDELRPELNEREKILLEERLLNDEPLTLQEIGEKYGITREAVRQAEVRLMKKIKERMETGE